MDSGDNYSHHGNMSSREEEGQEEEEEGEEHGGGREKPKRLLREKQKRWLKKKQVDECEENGISQFLSKWLRNNQHLRYLRGQDKRLISLWTGLSEREAEEWFVEMKYAYAEDGEGEEDWKGKSAHAGHGGSFVEEKRDYQHRGDNNGKTRRGYDRKGVEGDYRGYYGSEKGEPRRGRVHSSSVHWDHRGERGGDVHEKEGEGYSGRYYCMSSLGEDERGMVSRTARGSYYENYSPPHPAPSASAYHFRPGSQRGGNVTGEQKGVIGGSYKRYEDSSGSQGDLQQGGHLWVGYTKEHDDANHENMHWSHMKDREEWEVEEEKRRHWNYKKEERKLPMGEGQNSPKSPLRGLQVTGKRGLDRARDHGIGEYASNPKRECLSPEKDLPSFDDDELSGEQEGTQRETPDSDNSDFWERGDCVKETRVQQKLLNGRKENEDGEDGDHSQEDVNSKWQQEKGSTDTFGDPKKETMSGKLDKGGNENVTPEQADVLKEWLYSHVESPFLTEEERVRLCCKTNLSRNKIRQWFVNARLRKLEKHTKEDGTISYSLKVKKTRTKHDKETTSTLRKWLLNHKNDPFPNEEEKVALCVQTGISRSDLNIWFWNNRCHLLMKRVSENGETKYVEKPSSKRKRGRKPGPRSGQRILTFEI
eukprot:Nk52_evm6s62 gene=Nk52_evmTU6s62